MVAYSFNPRFEGPIMEGRKTQTIRADRKRHARPGEALQLFCGMRTRWCRRLLPDQTCTAVMQVKIAFNAEGLITGIRTDDTPVRNLDDFAHRDGFRDISDMSSFWVENHGNVIYDGFRGVLIEWCDPAQVRRVAA